MSQPPKVNECKQKGCKKPLADGSTSSCQKHLEDARERTRKRREKQAAASKPSSSSSKPSSQNSDASKLPPKRPPLLPANTPNPQPLRSKRKWREDDESDQDEMGMESTQRAVPNRHFTSQELLLNTLEMEYKREKGCIEFDAAYATPDVDFDNFSIEKRNTNDKDVAYELSQAIWEATKRRWKYKDTRIYKYGIHSKWCCSQDSGNRSVSKKKLKEGTKNRDKLPMRMYDCQSKLSIRIAHLNNGSREIHIQLVHQATHRAYYDIELPEEALEIIRQNLWSKPPHIAQNLRDMKDDWQRIKTYQVRHIWKKLLEANWRMAEDQLESSKLLLEKHAEMVDLLPIEEVQGVVVLGFGLKSVGERLKNTVEVGLDATYNTNAEDLELYALIAEHDNAGIPIAYLLLSTASSIEKDKRRRVLASFLGIVRDKYALAPRFVHTDKDMAEIGAAKEVWPESKHVLCRWHREKAVRDRSKLRKLATTKYDANKANKAYRFINVTFKPRVKADPNDNEGDDSTCDEPIAAIPPTQAVTFPSSQATGPNYIALRLPPRALGAPTATQVQRVMAEVDVEDSAEEEESNDDRVFCPERLRMPLTKMMDKHADAHPSIKGDHAPSAEGVREWAVRNAYLFCEENNVPELWAYLWGNWYRSGRWHLWTRAPHPEIPRLRTTMIVESHWRHLKHDWLLVWPKMRLDMLVYTLVSKITRKYKHVVDLILFPSGRARDHASWRVVFKREWKELENVETSKAGEFPYERYSPDPYKWICACPAYLKSRFLICKHLIQLCHPVSPWFFMEVDRAREAPFWSHSSLVPLSDDAGNATAAPDPFALWDSGEAPDFDPEHDDFDDGPPAEIVANFAANMESMAGDLESLASYIRHQIPYGEARVYTQFHKQCKRALTFHSDIQELERRNNAPEARRIGTWKQRHLMFIYTKASDR